MSNLTGPTARPLAPEMGSPRIRAATSLRALGHAFTAHDASNALLDRIRTVAEELTRAIEGAPARVRAIDAMKHDLFRTDVTEGESGDHFPECIVSGQANPMGIGIRVRRVGSEAVARIALGPAFEGAPGRAHGGIVAAIFDDTMGFVLTMERQPAFTGRLTVTYRAPTPMGEEIEFRARLVSRSERKLIIRGEATWGPTTVAEAEGLFIAIDPERFAQGAQP